ncbi:hypothetical protein KCG48_07310 [Proteiniclasticum sp. BAD-10]|uniref:Uncharacterized protein n=2 Tax=Proteiniclasticum sediminis TaxID=2804028 RepID=A0A941HR27_9CLOT|nr:hypothetical protein [Proteiniclasticum sediminis]
MKQKFIMALAGLLLVSFCMNAYLLVAMNRVEKITTTNSNRLQYLEDNLEKAVYEVVSKENFPHENSMVEDLSWGLSDILDAQKKTSQLNLQFKLKNIDTSSNVFVSVETVEGLEELVEVQLLNETTYAFEKIISVLEPLRIDLVVEKYGEKRIENLVDETMLYRKFTGDSTMNLLDFSYKYNETTHELNTSFSSQVIFSALMDLSVVKADIVIEKDGLVLSRLPMEKTKSAAPENQIYEGKVTNFKVLTQDPEIVDFTILIEDSKGFVYRYNFAKFRFISGEAVMQTNYLPELSMK